MTFKKTFEDALASHKPLRRGQIRPQTARDNRTATTSEGAVPTTQGLSRRMGLARKGKVAKKAKRPKKLTTGQWKKKAWAQFSIFIRTRGADENGMNQCVTCPPGTLAHWKDLQAGHFIAGRLNANLFDERGTNPQCMACNIYRNGAHVMYYRWMQKNHGEEVIDELILQNSQTHKWGANELQEIYEKYRATNKEGGYV